MTEIQSKAEQKILQFLSSIHQSLSRHPSTEGEARDLHPAEEQLMDQLKDSPFFYQTWVTLLAIDSYTSSIMDHTRKFEHLSSMLTVLLEGMKEMGECLKNDKERKKIISCYHNTFENLLECISINQELFPKSPLNHDQNLLIENSDHEIRAEETLISKIRQENSQLYKKLQMNDKKLLNMEFKLTKLLKEHEECERSNEYQVGTTLSYVELREELEFKQQEIERMNEEFTYEIEKYNTVYDAMKKELEDMKGYQNIDLIEQIEMLETEIVRLREQRERDQMIMRQIRNDNMMMSNNGGYGSPRHSKRFASPRFDY